MTALNFTLAKLRVADIIARSALHVPVLEKVIALGCRQPRLRQLGFGAVAHGYSRVLRRRELRVADFGTYQLWVNVAESLGIEPFFFGQSGVAWLTPSLVRQGDVCIDAGANVGHYTFFMASRVGRRGRIFAFDANPEMVEVIRRSIALNNYGSFIEVIPRALWSVAGQEMKFFLSVESKNSGTSSLIDHGWFLSDDHSVSVTTTTLDELARERSVQHFRLIKLDVERAEEQVLRGADTLLRERRVDYLIVELYAQGEAAGILDQHGYAGYLLDVNNRRLKPLSGVAADTFCDALFVSPLVREQFDHLFQGSIDAPSTS